jgi:threonylcarbamoyladenosine tRNA methylthiotransferase MtaB
MSETFKIITFGCKVNQYDSQLWRTFLKRSGLKESTEQGHCDICLINTCTVTAAADQQARQTVRKIQNQNQNTKIVVAGCYGQVNEKVLREIPQVDLVVGRYGEENAALVRQFLELGNNAFNEGIEEFTGQTRAFLKVQDGCNHKCSYCIVPLARGRSRSRHLTDIIQEAERLASAGHRELVVTGVRLGDFKPSLRVLLKSIHDVRGLERIRLSSLEPDDVNDEVIDTIGELSKVAKHLHLPLQSGDSGILKAMNRPYDQKYFAGLLDRAAKAVPGMTFGTDIIVGFPGETEQQFNRSYQAAQDLNITHLHVFTYSKRPGTKAAAMPGQIPAPVKKERSQRLREMFAEKQHKYWDSQAGQTTGVLFESFENGRWSGLDEHYFRVFVKSNQDLKNKMMSVKLVSANDSGMDGEFAD